jgi:hypothetical protein
VGEKPNQDSVRLTEVEAGEDVRSECETEQAAPTAVGGGEVGDV